MGELIIGHKTYGTVIRRGNMNTVTIGKYCSLASGIIVDSGFGHNVDFISTYPFNTFTGKGNPNVTCKGDVTIGNDVWIGEDVLIMSGVTISHGAIIAARSVVTKDVYPYEIVGGVPAKFIRQKISPFAIPKLIEIAWWDWPEEKILENADLLTSGNINEFIDKHYGK